MALTLVLLWRIISIEKVLPIDGRPLSLQEVTVRLQFWAVTSCFYLIACNIREISAIMNIQNIKRSCHVIIPTTPSLRRAGARSGPCMRGAPPTVIGSTGYKIAEFAG